MKRRWMWTILVIVYTGFIFSNSMTPADESSRQSGAVMNLLLQLLGSLGLEGGWVTEHLIRKTAHFVEYAVLGVLLWKCLETYEWRRQVSRMRLLCQGGLAVWIPLLDETIQLFIEGRSGQISDVWLDMAGVLAGSCFMWMMQRCLGRRGERG